MKYQVVGSDFGTGLIIARPGRGEVSTRTTTVTVAQLAQLALRGRRVYLTF